MDRREFVRRSTRLMLGAAAAPIAVACTSSKPEPTGTTSPPSSSPTPTGSSVPVQVNWTAFGDSLDGTLIRPGQSAYATAHQLYDPLFDGTHPAGIAMCTTVSDVQRSIVFARTNGLPFAARCGGHSYAGYSTSTGLVIDLAGLDAVTYDASSKHATIGSGVRLIDVAAGLAPSGVVVPGGTCATVGVSGLTLGGGQGILGRMFGLTCDSLQQVTIVTADGTARACDATSNQDLYWACRGGGGGNFGIVTSFVFRPHPLTHVTLFSLHWPWAAAADVMSAWQAWGPSAPDELWSDCHLLGSPAGNTASVNGAYVGSASALAPLLSRLKSAVGTAPSASSVNTMAYLDAALLEAGCSGWSPSQCRLPAQGAGGKLGREASLAKSDYFANAISGSALGSALGVIGERAQDPSLGSTGGGLLFDAWGGAINRVPSASTAFVHRRSKFLCQYFVSLPTGASLQAVSKNKAWLQELYGALHPSATGFAYQNYIDPDLKGWQQAYYGSNLTALIDVKTRYDPDDAFHFAQSIPVA